MNDCYVVLEVSQFHSINKTKTIKGTNLLNVTQINEDEHYVEHDQFATLITVGVKSVDNKETGFIQALLEDYVVEHRSEYLVTKKLSSNLLGHIYKTSDESILKPNDNSSSIIRLKSNSLINKDHSLSILPIISEQQSIDNRYSNLNVDSTEKRIINHFFSTNSNHYHICSSFFLT